MQCSVVKWGDPVLEKACEPVQDIAAVKHVIADLTDTLIAISKLYDFKRGHGIAAPQIGHSLRINVVEYDGSRHVLINPAIVETASEKILIREGCLSFFDVRGDVPRYESIIISALNENGEPFTLEATGNFAMLLQHEIDHLDGKLYVHHLPNGDKDLYDVEGMPNIP